MATKVARPSGMIDIAQAQEAVGESAERHYHPASREALKIKLTDQPWYRLNTTRKQADDYLASTPPGAFVLRPTTQGDSHVMDVQAGPRIGHVLLSHVNVNGVTYYQLPGTVHLFENLYDLVLFCHYNPFVFEKIDGTVAITLSIAMAKKAEKINIKRRKQKAEEDKAAEKANEQKRLEDEKQRLKQDTEEKKRREEEEERLRKEEAERVRREAEEEKRRREEEERLRREEEKRLREEEERARKEEEARRRAEEEERRKREAEERAQREAEDRERRKREAEESRRVIEEEQAKRDAEEKARQALQERARRASEAVVKGDLERMDASERARREAEDREAEERQRRLEEARRKAEEEERRKREEKERRRQEEAQREAEESRLREEERLRQAESAAALRSAPAPGFAGMFGAQFVQAKKPAHVKKVYSEINHPYDVHACLKCDGGLCPEGFKLNKFKPKICGYCCHTHELRDKKPAEPEPDAEEPKVGTRFYPRGSKVAALQVALGAVELEAPPKTAAQLKKEKAAAKAAAKEAARKAAREAKDARMRARETAQLRTKVGLNPQFVLDDPDAMDLDPFKDPYVLMNVDDPHDQNLTASRAKVELELHVLMGSITEMLGRTTKAALEIQLKRLTELEAQVIRHFEMPSDEGNDASILEAMSRTNPAAYQAIMEERVQALKERNESIKHVRAQVEELRDKIKKAMPAA